MSHGWPLVPLGEVATPVQRPIAVVPGKAYRTLGVKWWGQGAYERDTIDGSQTSAANLNEVRENDLIINKIWVRHGSVAIVDADVDGCVGSGEFPTFALDERRIAPRWVHWYTKTRGLWQQCDALSQGTSGKNRIRPERFLTVAIPLPQLAEQRRIVAKVEELAAKIEEAREKRRHSVQARNAVVASARNGYFSDLARRLVPVRLDEVAASRLGKMLSRNQSDNDDGAPYLRNANIQWDRLDLSTVYWMHVTAEEQTEFALINGDILVCEGGDIGKSAIWNGEVPGCIYQKALHRVRAHRSHVEPRFLLHHFFWAAEQGQFADIKTQTTIAHLTGVKLKAYQVLIPSLAEQRRIVAHLDALQAKVDALRALQARTAAELDALLPAVLDRAFRGAL